MSGCVRGAVIGLLAVAMLPPPSASASAGRIATASASFDWSSARISGAVYRTIECLKPPEYPRPPTSPGWLEPEPSPPPPEYFSLCAWIPYVTVGPADDCASPERRWLTGGSKVQVVWSGGERTGVGSAAFDLPDVALEFGADGPLLCLSVIEAAAEGIVCVQVVPSPCPPYAIVGRSYPLDSALLEPVPASPNVPVAETEVQPAVIIDRPLKRHCRRSRVRAKRGAGVKLKAGRKARCGLRRGSR